VNRELKTALTVTVVFLAGVGACLFLYFLFGHRLLTALYSGQSFPLLDRLAGNRNGQPLGQFLDKTDRRMVEYAVRAIVSYFFYLLFALTIHCLLKKDADSTYDAPQPAPGVRSSEIAGAFLIYSLLSITFFYPVLPHLTSQLIGPPEDNMASLWGMWQTHQAFQGHQNLLHTTRIFYPEGSSLLFSSSLYFWPFAIAAGGSQPPTTLYNLLVLSTFVLSGVGAFLLIRHITNDTVAALLGGFVFAFSPSHFAHSLHHVSIATVQFIPFFVLYYLKTMEDGSKKNVAWASVFFFLNTIVCWDYMVYAIFFMAAYYCVTAYRRRKLLMPASIISSLIIAGATLLVLSPLIVSMLISASRHSNVWMGGHDTLTIDILGLFVPHYYHWLAGVPLIARANGSYSSAFPWESVGYLGIICIGLILASSRVLVERAARYVLGLLLFLALSFGTNLHLMGRTIASALPYALISRIPILSGARAPGRIMAYVYLFLGVLVAMAFSYQVREGFLRKKGWLAALLGLGICVDFWTPCRETTQVRFPPAYTAILRQEQMVDFGILDLPGENSVLSSEYMMYQTMHHIPIVQGYLARKPTRSLVDSLEHSDLRAQSAQLRSAHVKYIVIHKRPAMQIAGPGYRNALDRYVKEYGKFFEDGENLVLRVY
jgi:hypothetical protein